MIGYSLDGDDRKRDCMELVPSNVDRLAESDARAHDRKWLDIEDPVCRECCSALVEYRWGVPYVRIVAYHGEDHMGTTYMATERLLQHIVRATK